MSHDPRRILALRIAARLRDIPRHQAALDVAVAAFDEPFSAGVLTATMAASEPDVLLRAYTVQAGFENLQNHLAGLARDGLELAGELDPAEPAATPRDFHRLMRLGVIGQATCDELIAAQRLRNVIQHAYGEIDPVALHNAVVMQQAEVGPFLDRYRRWLRSTLGSGDA